MSYRMRATGILVAIILAMAMVGCEGPGHEAQLTRAAPAVFGTAGDTHFPPTGIPAAPHSKEKEPVATSETDEPFAFQLPMGPMENPVTMAVTGEEGTVRVVYREGNEVLGTGLLPATGFAVGVNFSSPGSHLVTATAYGAGELLLGETSLVVEVLASASGPVEPPAATVQFLEPQWDTVANPVTFAVTASPSVVQVEYRGQGGELLGVGTPSGLDFEFTHLFDDYGSVVVEASGLDASGAVIAKAAKALFVSPPPESTSPNVPAPQPATASVNFVSPGGGLQQSPMVLAVEAQGDVSRVQYWLDQAWIVGDSWSPGTGFAVTSNINVGGEHVIEARAYDGQQNLVALTSQIVVVEVPDVATNLQEGTPPQAPEPTPAVGFVTPASPAVSTAASFKVTTQGPVVSVSYLVDGMWEIGSSQNAVAGFPLTYSFTVPGTRVVTAQARDGSNQVVATANKTLQVTLPPEPAQPPAQAPQPPAPGSNSSPSCSPGELPDCNGACALAKWINDGICDDGSQYSTVFTCPELGMDGADCGQQGASPCDGGQIQDCNGSCAKPEWINDGICDDGKQYNTVLTCPALGGDGNDCSGGGTGAPATPPASTPTSTAGSTGLPYFCQYDNALHPGSSCQNTSVAMVLSSLGWSGSPDTITGAWGKKHAQSPAGLAEVFNSYAQSMGSSAKLIPHVNGTISGLQALVAAGKPTIIHGYFTGSGHVVVVTGYTGSGYTVYDPAGTWVQSFKGGYASTCTGKNVTYGAAAFEKAVSTLDGSTYAPLWYHELVP